MATIRREIIRSQPQMPVAQAVPTSLPSYEGGEEKNKGGLIGGVGYLGEKVAVGAVQSIEGIFDYTLGGVAKLFGFDKFAERQFANDWFGDWYDHPDEWFNPGKGWQVAGDIAGGIGTSLPTLAVGLATSGAGLAMFGVAGLSAAGNATKEAYRETGKLGGREFAYGAMTGALEGGIETLTNLVGMGTGAVIKSFGKSLGKEFTESALRQGVGITLAKAFGGEAIEEGVAEIMSSRFKRWTYDADAEHASMGQILYASFVGGMSGVVMGGAGTVFSTAQNISRGTQLVESGQADAVIEHAKYISEKAKKGGIEVGAMKQVEATYNKLVKSLEKTGGEVKTVAQRQMLGELKIDNIAAELSPPMYKTVAAIAKDPDTFVEKLNAYGYTDANGNVRTVTKEQLMEGLDINNLKGTIPTALETNETLRDIVLMSMAGEMMINTSKFQESILRGEKFAGDADLENFLRVASPDEVKSVEKLFGIKDLRTVDAETFNEKVAEFQASGMYDEYLSRYNSQKTASAEAVNTGDNANIEENTANPVEESTTEERRAMPTDEQNTSASSGGEEMMTLVESMKFAKENVPEYKSLNADDQAKIRRLIRQAKANGFTDAQTRAYARVSARSGIDIVIGKEGLLIGKTETGADKYADGVYSPSRNKILVNPEGSRSPARVLMHELTHAIYKTEEIGKDGKPEQKLILEEGVKKLSDKAKKRIKENYFQDAEIDVASMTKKQRAVYHDELNAHYIEAMLDDEALLEKLCEDNPTLPDKILSFFKKAITGYSDEPTLSREAKKLYKRYKTLFEMFAEKNQYADTKNQGEESTGIRFAKPIEEYPYNMQTVIQEYLESADANIEDFIDDALSETNEKRLEYMHRDFVNDIPHNVLSNIKELVGFDVSEYGIRINGECIHHIDRMHGKQGIHDHSMQNKKDIARIQYIVSNADKAEYTVDSSNRIVMDHQYRNSDNTKSHVISITKRINGTYYVVCAVPDSKSMLMHIKSAYISKKEATQEFDATNAPNRTSKTNLEIASKDIIDDSSKKNNPFGENSSKKVSTNSGDRKALPDTDSEGTALSPEQREYFADTKVVDAQGQLLVLYHQTAADFTEFDTMREGAGARDNETPHGIFLKPTPDDIGLKGDKQMRLYVNITNPLIFHDRASSLLHWKQNIEGYKEIIEEISNNDRKYQDLFDEAFSERRMARKLKNMEFSDLDRAEKLRIVEESSKASEKVIDEWTEANTKLDKKAKALIDDYLKNSDYDGVIIDEDQGSFGRKVKTYIALHPEQVKNVDNTAPTNNPDIRYALPDEAYLDAVNRGDMETAQRMVDEAAKKAGYDYHLYHGTDADFTVFDLRKHGGQNGKGEGYGIYLAANREISEPYGKNVIDSYTKFTRLAEGNKKTLSFAEVKKIVKKSCEIDAKRAVEDGEYDSVDDAIRDTWVSNVVYTYDYSSMSQVYADVANSLWKQNDNDGDLINEIMALSGAHYDYHNALDFYETVLTPTTRIDGFHYIWGNKDGSGVQNDIYLAFSSNQIKSADPVTYDENGNVIPLSQRFNSKNDDIRYAMPNEDGADEVLRNGTRVKANDRGNIGVITGYNSGVYSVRFTSKEGLSRTLQMTAEEFEPLKKKTKTTASASGDAEENENPLDMSSSVGKKRQEYKASFKERIFTVADSVYIDTVDEYYGAEKYLRKFGKKKNAASILQAIRASMSAAQVMIGDVQKDIFSEDGKTLGEGLSKIVKPITVKGETIKRTFNEYLMHHLNVDRMSLEEKSLAKLDEESLVQLEEMKAKLEDDAQKVRELNEKIAELKDKKKSIFSDEEAQKQIDQRIAEYQREAKALKADILEQKKQIDNFEIMKNKPVFGENEARAEAITAEQSLKRIAELEKAHPDFRETAEKVWAYTKNLNHMRVEAGLISAESEAYMNELYPHYVPAYRDTNGGGAAAIKGRRNLAISSTVKSAKGSGLDILDVMDSIAAQTQEVIRAGRINQLFRTIYDTAMLGNGTEYVEIVSRQKVSGKQVADESAEGEMPNTIELRPKNNQVTGFVNGEKVTLSVSDEIFIAFDSMSKPTVDPTSAIGKGLQKLNDIYKRLITSYSPAFLLRNPIRDIQDAGLNSKHPIEFARNLVKVYKMMLENSEEWQTYRAYGGYSASIFGQDGFSADVDSRGFEAMAKLFDTDAPTMKDFFEAAKRGGKNLLTGINNVNAFVEQATRFAEYLASVEAGDSIPNAINNAAEVTTNFGRRGRVTKVFNATIMPFLNPAVQGFDKMFRNVGDAFKEGSGAAIAKALGVLFAKAAAIGLAPMVINMLMYGDDEDYEQLREEDKENNFLIKVGDTFIKIPRGRVASVIGGTANRASKLAKGEDADLKGYAENVLSQVTPVGNLTRTIFSPFFDVKNNRTWYGTEIEGRQWDNTAPKDRYDESTSSIAIGIGKVTNYSPKKIHYLLDQYSGVIGDFVLPATSKKATKDFFSGNFTIDAATSNKLSSQFYDMYDRAQYAKTAGDDTAIYQVKYLNSVKDAVSKLHDEKQAIQNDSELSNVEKLQKSRVVQILINEAYKTALTDIERYTQAFEATAGIEKTATFQSAFGTSATDATIQKMRYTEATRYMYGAKKALEEYDDKVYEKCELLNSAGVDYDKLYYYYFSTKGLTSDVDKKGNTVSGSKRKKVVATINALDIPNVQKALLICAQGYTLQSGDVKGVTEKKLLSYILKLNTSKQVKENLAKLCGFEVKNGKIVIK